MIKECRVIYANEYVTVVKYENRHIQLPPIKGNSKDIHVEFDGHRYRIIDESEYEIFSKKYNRSKKSSEKKAAQNYEEFHTNIVDNNICNEHESC